MSSEQELVDHVLRRCTFGPTDAQRSRFDGSSPAEVVEALLADPHEPLNPPSLPDDEEEQFDVVVTWWIDRMRGDDAGGLSQRMLWFWHGHLTTSLEKASPTTMVQQLALLSRHTFGNFRTLLHEITLDPAMLLYLDGNGSTAAAPNENYARELMELFALGRDSGAYSEADVQAGARALAGWWVVDWDDDDRPIDEPYAVFESEDALDRPVEFLGRRVRTAAGVVDTVCDHPACAPFVVGEIHEYFVGAPPSDRRRAELADLFRSSGLEIRPVVEAVLRHPSFLEGANGRPRSPIEWFFAFQRLVGMSIEPWVLEELGQLPMHPPNVAGWPDPERWLAGGAVITKAQAAVDLSWDAAELDPSDPVADVLRRAGLTSVGSSTRSALEALAADRRLGFGDTSSLLVAAVAMCPEFNVG